MHTTGTRKAFPFLRMHQPIKFLPRGNRVRDLYWPASGSHVPARFVVTCKLYPVTFEDQVRIAFVPAKVSASAGAAKC